MLPQIKDRLSRILPSSVIDGIVPRRPDIEVALNKRQDVDPRVADVVLQVPRREFVRRTDCDFARQDRALAIGHGQTISQPSLVAHMVSELKLAENSAHVLDVGCGSGYQAAILSRLAEKVISVERVAPLADSARSRLKRLGYANVDVVLASKDVLGYPELGPYDGIIVGASVPSIPQSLVDQLAPNGRMVIPVGNRISQKVVTVVKIGNETSVQEGLGCVFVPLIGPEAW